MAGRIKKKAIVVAAVVAVAIGLLSGCTIRAAENTTPPEESATPPTPMAAVTFPSETVNPDKPVEPAPKGDVNWLLWGGVGLAVVVLAVVVAILLLRRRAAKSRPGPDPLPELEPKPKPEPESKTVMVAELKGIRAANLQGIGARKNQQDSFGVTDVADTSRGVLAVVADGVGGTSHGAEISRMVTSHLLQSFQTYQPSQGAPGEFLLRVAHEAQRKVRSFLLGQGGIAGGSTLVAAFIKDRGLYFLSVGDSRVCLLRSNSLVQLNREHTYAAHLDEKAARGEITTASARGDKQRNSLTSYMGIEEQLQIDSNLKPIPLISGDRVLLMTDGVFGSITEAELTAAAGRPDIFEAAASIERAVVNRRKPNQDNFTAILLEYFSGCL